jgi:AraC family transcriptional regulator
VVEITAPASVRRAIADEMGIPHAAALDDLHGGTDRGIWAIATSLRMVLRGGVEAADLEYDQLIWQLYRHVFAARFGGRLRTKGDGKLDPRRQDRVLAFIEAHLADAGLSIAALADTAALSTFHFLRSFRRTFNMTPHRYVRARRLERVREEIAHGRDPGEAARRYGFTHIGHFRAAYRRHHGIAPGEEFYSHLGRFSKTSFATGSAENTFGQPT